MKIVKQSFEMLYPENEIGLIKECQLIERAARTCYKSEDKITDNSWKKFVFILKDKNHTAMLEFGRLVVKVITNRGVLAEWTRHRHFSYAVESTRYCNYTKDKFNNEITVIEPFQREKNIIAYDAWKSSCETSEKEYFKMIQNGESPQIARSVLPQSLKCEMTVSGNFREWLLFLKLRTASSAHPDIRFISSIIGLEVFVDIMPELLDDELAATIINNLKYN
jgi:thymidylate synthase (FAD)